MSARTSPRAPTLADDFARAQKAIPPSDPWTPPSGDAPISLEAHLLAAIWFSLERLTAAVQASAQVDDWEASEAATQAKAQEVGLTARLGEKMPDFRARIRAALRSEGGRG